MSAASAANSTFAAPPGDRAPASARVGDPGAAASCAPQIAPALLKMTSDIVLVVDSASLRLRDASGAACVHLRYSRRGLRTRSLAELIAPRRRDAFLFRLRELVAGMAADRVTVRRRLRLRRRDRSELPVEARLCMISDRCGDLLVVAAQPAAAAGPVIATTDATRLDPLTRLPDRALLEQRLRASLTRACDGSVRLGVMLIDLDRFKAVNDARGHLAGDRVLRTVARRLARCVRREDVVVRYGGDEFVVLLDAVADAERVPRMAERILAAIRKPLRIQNETLQLSASIGIAVTDGRPASATRLLAAADRGLYEAKSLGREGRFVIHAAHRSRLPRPGPEAGPG
jgi:diguanylate cyclase (GGDEF)-like protein